MKKPTYCCDGTCEQGDKCVNRRASPPTKREWALTLALLAFGITLSIIYQ